MRTPFFFATLLVLTSCGTQKINIGAVKSFASATKDIAANTTAVYKNMWELKYDVVQLSIATVDSPAYLIESLNENYQQKTESESNAIGYSSLYGVLSTYSTLLLALTSEDDFKNLKKEAGDLQCSMDSVVKKYNRFCRKPLPLSLGNFVSRIVVAAGDFQLKKMQKMFLKESIDSGYSAIMDICDNYNTLFAPRIKQDIDRLPNDINDAYTGFLETIRSAKNPSINQPYLFYANYNPLYLDMIRRHQQIEQVFKQNVAAIESIRKSITRLKNAYEVKLTSEEWITENKNLVVSAHELKKAYLALTNKK
ncbi:MAG: hypothetical protein V4722_03970 [Bacteroidota bacterium]